MNKHDDARNCCANYAPNPEIEEELLNYINEAEATEKRLQELEKDVNDFFTLVKIFDVGFDLTSKQWEKYELLKTKLSKVGKEV